MDGQRIAPHLLGDLCRDTFGRRLVDIRDNDLRTGLPEAQAVGFTDAVAAAGDNDDFILQSLDHLS